MLSSDDPVRVFQEFATVDLLSGGRAEIAGRRGSFIESFPLFGYDLRDYDELFAELDLLLGSYGRRASPGRERTARPLQVGLPTAREDPLPIWVAVGGNPESALRAGRLGLPMALAIIGGRPERHRAFAELHHAARSTWPPPRLSIDSHGYVADTAERAADEFFPPYAAVAPSAPSAAGRRSPGRTSTPSARCAARSSWGIRSRWSRRSVPHDLFGHQRFLAQIGVGTLHAQVLAIELLGTEVAPAVRAEVARRLAPAVPRSPPTEPFAYAISTVRYR